MKLEKKQAAEHRHKFSHREVFRGESFCVAQPVSPESETKVMVLCKGVRALLFIQCHNISLDYKSSVSQIPNSTAVQQTLKAKQQ